MSTKRSSTDPPTSSVRETSVDENGTQIQPPKKEPEKVLSGEFGRYVIDRRLGTGAMGAVYRAHDTKLNRKVALKIPKILATDQETFLKRFYREARAAAALTHAHICPVYDVGEIDGTHYIAMGYISGKTLSTFIDPEQPVLPRTAAIFVRKTALAMQEAHKHGVVHRDLKPDNIMVDKRGEPVVMDFGLARHVDYEEDERLTRHGIVMGSPAYMPPEQIEGSPEKVGPLSDVYALGVTFFELLTGELPFRGNGTVMSMIADIYSKEPPLPSSINADIPDQLSNICLKAIAKKPSQRQQSMQELVDELTAYLKATSGSLNASISSQIGTDTETPPSAGKVRAEAQQDLVRTLCDDQQYAAAVSVLQKMTTVEGDDVEQISQWAMKQLPKVQSLAAKHSGEVTQTAKVTKTPKQPAKKARKKRKSEEFSVATDDALEGVDAEDASRLPARRMTSHEKQQLADQAQLQKILFMVVGGAIVLVFFLFAASSFFSDGSNAVTPQQPPVEDAVNSDSFDKNTDGLPTESPQTFQPEVAASNSDRLFQPERVGSAANTPDTNKPTTAVNPSSETTPEPTSEPMPEFPQRKPKPVVRKFKILDQNNDGVLTLEEIPRNERAIYYTADKNNDGQITRREYLNEFPLSESDETPDAPPAKKPKPPEKPLPIPDYVREAFKRFDKNNDQFILRNELPRPFGRYFNDADRDNNGKLDHSEVEAHPLPGTAPDGFNPKLGPPGGGPLRRP
ncbi:protein kinase domain-containing protein [Calycomorphotria hydatis]|uniref:Serine/threonine-protein kinase PrkC n=1 Tax=Calycomorphotria hydatis TaxID=2528027 RepID=A0A517T699_9PLAN|nr:protein kinase [Calycomorphotria hydatis]QDT63899.1 Serine/threonine-protein kinase PrkC [Calycomorphotria hydatis]